ncbi:MAG: hypothetical protein KKD31_07570 [Bacteroidetes bacterium]|nr:hypothetical protein [Bacteroidota bacterium]
MKPRYIYHYQIAQASPLGEVGEVFVQAPDATMGLNRYSYALGNPLAFTDPSGYEVTGGPISSQPHLQELNHQRSMERYNWLESFEGSRLSGEGFHAIMGGGALAGGALSGILTPEGITNAIKKDLYKSDGASIIAILNAIREANESGKYYFDPKDLFYNFPVLGTNTPVIFSQRI